MPHDSGLFIIVGGLTTEWDNPSSMLFMHALGW